MRLQGWAWAFLACSVLFAGESSATTSEVAGSMAKAATAFLESLDDAARTKATMPFDDPARRDWHNIPKPKRKGLQLRDMTAAQRQLCFDLLRTALSESGYEKAQRIMSLENNLREGERGQANAPLRDPQRYFLTIFGKPRDQGAWGWSFEGHHFSLNFTIRNGEVVGVTPSFWGANPATVRVEVAGGPRSGVRTLAKEEQLGLDLVNGLNAEQRHAAVIAAEAPAEYRAAGAPQPPHTPPEGIAATSLSEAQRSQLVELLTTYTQHLAPALAAAQMAEIDQHGLDRIHFAWAGATEPGAGHYYRVQGPTFVLELINVQSDPAGNKANHIHSVWRELPEDFGL